MITTDTRNELGTTVAKDLRMVMQGKVAIAGEASYEGVPVEALEYDFNLSKLERVMSGAGKAAALGHELERRRLKRTIVVTGKTLGGSALLGKVTGAAGARCVAVFKGARQHVPWSSVHELQALIERENADSLMCFRHWSAVISATKRKVSWVFAFAACTAAVFGGFAQALGQTQSSSYSVGAGREVKVMIVTMFGLEAKTWLDRLGPWDTISVPGLAPDYHDVHCNRKGVCVMTTDMGHANAAASLMALSFTNQFDLRHTYFLIAGIAGIDPMQGTLGSVAWAKYLVEFSAQWELDSREKPAGWPSGFVADGAETPDALPKIENHTEVFEINPDLVNVGVSLSQNVALADSPEAQDTRAKYAYAPANRPPTVLQCDTLSDDTWWSGDLIGDRARTWTKELTRGKGTYCTSQEEDNATYEALTRAAAAGRVDLKRIAVLRAGSDFDRQHKGQTASENLFSFESAGGFAPAVENLYRAGLPLITNISEYWQEWRGGVPSHLNPSSGESHSDRK